MSIKHSETIRNIKSLNPTLDRLIEACPFDNSKNLNKYFTPEFFFDEEEGLYQETDESKELRLKITKDFFSGNWNKRILFLYGYSGIGKSTFLRKLIVDCEKKLQPEILDFQEVIKKIKSNEEISKKQTEKKENGNENPIVAGLQQYLYFQDSSNISEFYRFLKTKKSNLQLYLSDFFSYSDKYKIGEDDDLSDTFKKLILKCNLNDILHLFFLYVMKKVENLEKDHTIIIFDNLDGIDLDYFSEDFRVVFPNILDQITSLSQTDGLFKRSIDFVSHFKFIFCLRDANNSQVNCNNYDKIWNNSIEEKLMFDDETYEKAFVKRIKFISKIYSEDEIFSRIGINSDQLIKIIEVYFNQATYSNVFLPLFNFDFRKLTTSLFSAITSLGVNALNLLSDDGLIFYATNSQIFKPIIASLAKNNYIEGFYKQKIDWEIPDGYCHPARVITTFIINHSNKRINSNERMSIISEPISLFDLVSHFDKIYTPETIIDVLISLFKYHSDSWIHPITIKNKVVKDITSFKGELKQLKQIKKYLEKELSGKSLTAKEQNHFNEIRSKLEKIKIRQNPASLAYLRHISTNYDYYLSINDFDKSLFAYPKEDILSDDSAVVKLMNKTLETSTNHVMVMNRFLDSRYFGLKNYSLEEYKLSKYSWKYSFRSTKPQKNGTLHSRRIITNHITYLNNFRKYSIKQFDSKDDMVTVNKKITRIIRGYVNLLKNSYDPDDIAIFYSNYLSRIDAIKTSGYSKLNIDIIPALWTQ